MLRIHGFVNEKNFKRLMEPVEKTGTSVPIFFKPLEGDPAVPDSCIIIPTSIED